MPLATPQGKKPFQVRLAQGTRQIVRFDHHILKVDYADTTKIAVWAVNSRTIVVEGKQPGTAVLTVTTARHTADRTGEPELHQVTVFAPDMNANATAEANATSRVAAPADTSMPVNAVSLVQTYILKSMIVADTIPQEKALIVDAFPNVIFKSLESPALRNWVITLPAGSKILLEIPGNGLAPDSLATGDNGLELFQQLCQDKGLHFGLLSNRRNKNP
jgi:hypothetical protein